MFESNSSISGLAGSRTTTVMAAPAGHFRVSHLKILVSSAAERACVLFSLLTMTAICFAADEPWARQMKKNIHIIKRQIFLPGCIQMYSHSRNGSIICMHYKGNKSPLRPVLAGQHLFLHGRNTATGIFIDSISEPPRSTVAHQVRTANLAGLQTTAPAQSRSSTNDP